VIWASAHNEHKELFFTAAGSCGSLGVVTLLEMELIDARKYVELEYIPVHSVQDAVKEFEKYQDLPDVDYLDGILYSQTSGVIMVGRLTDEMLDTGVSRFDRPADPWFYMHAEGILGRTANAKLNHKETIPVQPYLFRYDRGVFWSGLRAFKYFLTPFNRITRYLLDPFMYSRTMVHALHRSGLSSRTIIQDYGIPYEAADEFIRWTDERTGIWPLWLCPVKSAPRDERSFSQGNNIKTGILLDVGIWDMGPAEPSSFIRLNREFEAKVAELGGMKVSQQIEWELLWH
jgi:Delta24-sterol reductase